MIAVKSMRINDQIKLFGGTGPNPSEPPDGDVTIPSPLNTGNQAGGGA